MSIEVEPLSRVDASKLAIEATVTATSHSNVAALLPRSGLEPLLVVVLRTKIIYCVRSRKKRVRPVIGIVTDFRFPFTTGAVATAVQLAAPRLSVDWS